MWSALFYFGAMVVYLFLAQLFPPWFTSTKLFTVSVFLFPIAVLVIFGAISSKKKNSSPPLNGFLDVEATEPRPAPKKTTRFLRYILYLIIFCVLLRACGAITHPSHDWQPATCTEPRTCSTCHTTDGEPLGHDWQPPTCTSPKTCARCGATEGFRSEHQYIPATCTEPEQCITCGAKLHWYSLPLGHKWIDATCSVPKTCSVCGATEGEPLGHTSLQHITTIEPTCQTEGEREFICYYCGGTFTEVVPTIDHKAGDYQVIKKATPSSPGIDKRYCTMCGLEMESVERPYLDLGQSSHTGSGNSFNTYDNEGQQNTSAKYVLNTSTMKFHRPSCRDVPKISPGNYATSNQSRSDLIACGYSSCGHCSP